MDPHGVSDMAMNSERLDDDIWHLNWDEFFAFEGQQPLQPSNEIPVDCDESAAPNSLMNGGEMIGEATTEDASNCKSRPVCFPAVN